MRNHLVLVFVLVMTAAGLFIANFRKEELPPVPVRTATAEPAPGASGNLLKHFLIEPAYAPNETAGPKPALAAPAVKPSAVPRLPPAETKSTTEAAPAPKSEPDSFFGSLFTVSSYAPEETQADREVFRGPVCVKIENQPGKDLALTGMNASEIETYRKHLDYAVLFLKSTCAKYAAMSPPVYFENKAGEKISQYSDYGFIFFDGVKDPRVVKDPAKIKEGYYDYFSDPQ